MAKEQRFVINRREGALSGTRIITDVKTGVQYLYYFEGYGGGLSVMVDRDGKPLIDEQYRVHETDSAQN